MKSIISIFFVVISAGALILWNSDTKTPLNDPGQIYERSVLLLPLDSRPACTDFVVDLGKIANIKLITPPPEILDNYKKPGDIAKLRNWLIENSKTTDAAIVSIDMLVHGGLLSSRNSDGSAADAANALAAIEQIHAERPEYPIYAFHILPRLLLSDTAENKRYQKIMLEYSKLKDQVYTFGDPADTKRLLDLEKKIPQDVLGQYHRLYEENIELNKTLIDMNRRGVIEKLVIGQDDGHVFGIPNLAKRRLLHYLEQEGVGLDQAIITRGADEVALNLLGELSNRIDGYRPKVNVQYADDFTPRMVMPFMPNSVATTVSEKISMLDGEIVDDPDAADFILFVYVGTYENRDRRFAANRRIRDLLDQNYKVALVDLSEHFLAEETVFPMLMNNGAPLNQLIAYAGWNTTSNSVGTALTQASIFTAKLKRHLYGQPLLTLYKNNLTFLAERYLEDYFYLKQVIDTVNARLKKEQVDVYGLSEAYPSANRWMAEAMNQKAYLLKNSKAYQTPILIKSEKGNIKIQVSDLSIAARYPWTRTFEIDLEPEISLTKISRNSTD